MQEMNKNTQVAILGAGIAGLSSGWLLQNTNLEFQIIEKQPYVGGLARSFTWHGINCDFGAHRLFSKNQEILQELIKLVPMGRHIRRSKIYLKEQYLQDPISILELLKSVRFSERVSIIQGFLLRPRISHVANFENYVLKNMGKACINYFFNPIQKNYLGSRVHKYLSNGLEKKSVWPIH